MTHSSRAIVARSARSPEKRLRAVFAGPGRSLARPVGSHVPMPLFWDIPTQLRRSLSQGGANVVPVAVIVSS
jgi:hypothetical protein